MHTSLPRILGPLLAAFSVCLAGCASPSPGASVGEQAWVQADSQGRWQVRAITSAPACPSLRWNGGRLPMQQRSEPGTVPARANAAQPDTKASVFKLRSCEVAWPEAATEVAVGTFRLARPARELRRIVLIGDTGCRMKQSEQSFQDCLDPQQWPFAAVARAASALQPDLVVHVGDIHYRESPCPAQRPGCAGSPWGYGDDAWVADLFEPAAPLLAAAPWVFVRGNHESCSRAGLGWFRFLDAAPWSAQRNCVEPADDSQGDFSDPYAVPLSDDTQLIVFDSSFASGRAYAPDAPAYQRYQGQLRLAERLARQRPHSFFLNHHPVLGFAGSADGTVKPGNAALWSVMSATHPERLYADGVDLVLNGHVHLFEALGFASSHPATLVLGNSGSQMEGRVSPDQARAAQPAPGVRVETFATQNGFGFAVLDKEGDDWRFTEHDVQGRPLLTCRLSAARLRC